MEPGKDVRAGPEMFERGRIDRGRWAAAAFALAAAACAAAAAQEVSPRPDANFRALALQWFERMETGAIDRTQLAPAYSAALTDASVEAMARRLKAYDYGAAPLDAEVVRVETRGGQTLAVVRLVFPRGDSASLLIGLDADGKIAGLTIMSMAGD